MTIQVRVLEAQARRALASLRGDLARVNTAAAAAAAGAGGIGTAQQMSALTRWGSRVQWAGRQLQYNFTLPLAIAGAAATKFYMDNEAAMTRLRKVYGDVGEDQAKLRVETDKLSKAFEALSEIYAVTRSEVTGIGADWAAAGAEGLGLAKAVETTMKVMVIGEMNAKEATEALIAVQSQYRLNTEELSVTIAELNMIENQTGLTLSGLIQGFARAAGVANTAGINTRYLGAMLAALSPAAGSATQAGNAVKTIVSRLLSPTAEATEILKLLNIQTDAMAWKSINAAQKLELLSGTFMELDDAQKSVVSSTLASRWQINKFDVLMRAIADPLSFYNKALEATADAGRNLAQVQRELNEVLSSDPKNLQRVWIVLQNAMTKIIAPMVPYIIALAKSVANAAQAFADMDPYLQKFILLGLGLLALVGPIARYIGAISLLMGLWKDGAAKVGPRIDGLTKKFWAFLAWPYRAVMTAWGAVVGSFVTGSKAIAAGFLTSQAANAAHIRTSGSLFQKFGLFVGGVFKSVAGYLTGLFAPAIAATRGFVAKQFAAMGRSVVGFVKTLAFGLTNNLYLPQFIISMRRAGFAVANFAKSSMLSLALFWNGFTGTISRLVLRMKAFSLAPFWFAIQQGMMYAQIVLAAGMAKIRMSYFRLLYIWIPDVVTAGWAYVSRIWLASYTKVAVLWAAVTQKSFWIHIGSQFKTFFFATLPSLIVTGWKFIGRTLLAAQAKVYVAAYLMTSGFVAKTAALFKALPLLIFNSLSKASMAMGAWLTTIGPRMLVAIKGIPAALKGLGPALLTGLKGFGSILLKVITGPIGLAVTAVLAIFTFFGDEIRELWGKILDSFARNAGGIKSAFEPLVSWFQGMVAKIRDAFYKLPEGVQEALMAVVRIVRTVAEKVYEFFQYLNPFARHSPSLVESVTAGVAIIRSQYASLGNVGSVFFKAAGDLRAFKSAATQGAVTEDQVKAQEAVVRQWGDALEAANAILSVQQAILRDMEDDLRALESAYSASEARIDEYANAALVGMGAYSDALFENEMAQKSLRLEMLRLEQAGVPIQSVQNQLASLQGDIEALRGQSSDLRAAGAGQEILGPIQAQISQMEAAYDAISSGVGGGATGEMQAELERLQREAEILDLEQSLQFDPLTRQIQGLADATQELSFNEVVAGIQAEQAAMAALQPQIAAATQEVQAQSAVVDQLSLARDALSFRYDIEREKLESLKEAYDAVKSAAEAAGAAGDTLNSPAARNFLAAEGGNYPDVAGSGAVFEQGDLDAYIESLNEEMADLWAGFDMFGPIKRAWNAFLGWWGTNVQPGLSAVWGAITEAFSGVDFQGALEGMMDWFAGIGETLGDVLAPVWDLFGPQIQEVWDKLVESVKVVWDMVSAEFSKWSDLGEPILQALENIWNVLKPILAVLAGAVVAIFSTVFSVIGNIIGPIVEMVGSVISSIIQIVRGVIDVIVGIFTLDLGRIGDGLSTIIGGIWSMIYSVVEGAIGVVSGLIQGVFEGLGDFFIWLWDLIDDSIGDWVKGIGDWFGDLWQTIVDWVTNIYDSVVGWFTNLWDELVGHSIIPDMVNAIIDYFEDLLNGVVDWVKEIYDGVVQWFGDMYTSAVETVQGFIDDIDGKFKDLRKWVVTTVTDLRDKIVGWFQSAKDGVLEHFNLLWSGAEYYWGLLEGAGKTAYDWMKRNVFDPIGNAVDAVGQVFDRTGLFIEETWKKIRAAAAAPVNFIINTVYTNGIKAAWDKVASTLGLSFRLPTISPIPGYAGGGVLPGYSPGRDVHEFYSPTGGRLALSGGEAIMRPEWTRAVGGPAAVAAMNAAARGGRQAFADGGVWGWVSEKVGQIGSGIRDMVVSVASVMADPVNALKDLISAPTERLLSSVGGGMIGQMLVEVPRRIVSGIIDKARGLVANLVPSDAMPGATGWVRPSRGPITSEYGPRWGAFHAGIDVAGGGPTYAAGSGVVVRTGSGLLTGRTGLGILLRHANNIYTYYGHNPLGGIRVAAGQSVVAGQHIGYQGATGNVTGTHLHFEVHRNLGSTVNPRNLGVFDNGGVLSAGNVAMNRSLRPEAIFTQSQWNSIHQLASLGASVALGARNRAEESVQAGPTVQNVNVHIHGDLSFPNITDGEDAETFIRNLQDLAG